MKYFRLVEKQIVSTFCSFMQWPLARIRICLLVCCVPSLFLDISRAEITYDGSLGFGGQPERIGNNYSIPYSEGLVSGQNLFHSFDQFNILNGESATFTGPNTIDNIVGRVTGGASSINGVLRSDIDGANLFLLNPFGVLFGSEARLEVSGSFHVSTADFLQFEDGKTFSARLGANSELTVASPIAFGFLTANPAAINIQGSSLSVPEEQTLSVTGGDIEIKGASVEAPSGQINLVSAASEATVVLNDFDDTSNPQVEPFQNLGNIDLLEAASINAGGDGGGTVVIRGGRLTLNDSSTVYASTKGPVNTSFSGVTGEGIDIQVKDEVILDNNSIIGTNVFGFVEEDSGGIRIKTDHLEVSNAADIQSIAFGDSSGDSGDIEISTSSLKVRDNGLIGSRTLGLGDSGNVTVDTASLVIQDAGLIFTNSDNTLNGTGASGNIKVSAEHILLSNKNARNSLTGIFSETSTIGKAGDIHIETDNLKILENTEISTPTRGLGQGGHIKIKAHDSISIAGSNDPSGTGIFANTFSSGNGGHITVIAANMDMTNRTSLQAGPIESAEGDAGGVTVTISGSLELRNGSFIGTGALFGKGNGADLHVSAKDILIVGIKDSIDPAGSDFTGFSASVDSSQGGDIHVTAENLQVKEKGLISASTEGSGNSGDVNIAVTGDLLITDGGQITTIASGNGDAGDIDVTASNLILSGINAIPAVSNVGTEGPVPSAISTRTQLADGSGNSGDIRITTTTLKVSDDAMLDTGTLNLGAGGDIQITTDNLEVSGGFVQAETFGVGKGGNITVNADRLSLTEAGQISVSTRGDGRGGNLTVTAVDVLLLGADSADLPAGLFANTEGRGQGGTLQLLADNLAVHDGAQIRVSTSGEGRGGNLNLNAKYVLLTGSIKFEGKNTPALLATRTFGNGDAGDLWLTVGSLEIRDGAQVSTSTFNSGVGGNIQVNANDIFLTPSDFIGVNSGLSTGLFARGNLGNAGNIKITTNSLDIIDGAAISASSTNSGIGGDINVIAEDISIIGVSRFNNRAGIFTQSDDSLATGDAGDIRITAKELALQDGGQITVAALGPGNAGELDINAETIVISGRDSGLSARISASTHTSAQGGSVRMTSGSVEVKDGALIQTSTFNSGNAGSIEVTADSVLLTGVNSGAASRIVSQSARGSSGKSGNVRVTTDTLQIRDGAEISATSFGTGKGGFISVNANSMLMSGGDHPNFGVGVFASTEVDGKSGDIFIAASELEVTNSAQISVSAVNGAGDAGLIEINADHVRVSGSHDAQVTTGVFASSDSNGDGGQIQMIGDIMEVKGGTIATETSGPGLGGDIVLQVEYLHLLETADISTRSINETDNAGNAGNIRIVATNTFLSENSTVTTEARQAQGGEIVVIADTMVRLRNSQVNTTVAGGDEKAGNITIDPEFVIVENSQIIAQAIGGPGGNIRIVASEAVLINPNSIVDASSEKNVDGEIDIRAPVTNLSSNIELLPQKFAARPRIQCAERWRGGNVSRFVRRGHDGLPTNPSSLLPSAFPMLDLDTSDVISTTEWQDGMFESSDIIDFEYQVTQLKNKNPQEFSQFRCGEHWNSRIPL